ncbi:MAG: NAD-dependent succinate-semialdehyde dehydrogenase [Caulobacteraceae bacterium]|nr:NAD-dependent succinate-semialdehyde dehydrogenase [Caulobacteraceae bacterium]
MSGRPTYDPLFLFIGGAWIAAEGRAASPVVDPATGETIGAVPLAGPDDLDRALEAAWKGFAAWRAVPAFERGKLLRRAAELIRARAEASAVQLTLEEGKLLAEARQEVAAAADIFDWFAEEGRRAYGRVIPARAEASRFTVQREPVGPMAAFTPWNFPATGPARKIAASLAAGCSCIIKPAEETPATALAIARALDEAGLPKGVLNVVFGDPAAVSAHLIASPVIRKISFTGSTRVGRLLGALAADGVKRTTLELGGHAPVIVFEDADLDRAVSLALAAKFRNAGQVCTSPTRFYLHETLHDRFVEAFAAGAQAMTVGDGLAAESRMGPLANPRRLSAMEALVDDALRTGASLAAGGRRVGDQGFFWRPTVLADTPASARIMNEEPFGPIIVTQAFDDLDAVVAEANRLPFGLAAYAFTRSLSTATAISERLESGMVGLNTFTITVPETPFGGVKQSGHGREGGLEGLDAYLVAKLVSQM